MGNKTKSNVVVVEFKQWEKAEKVDDVMQHSVKAFTGGMTSTPALGTLINVAGSDDVAGAYAATYPIALIAVVLASQFLILLL